MPTLDETLLAIAPELGSVDESRRSQILDIAGQRVGLTAYGANRDIAVVYLAAHLLTVGQRGSVTGPVSSVKEGDLQINYKSTSDNSGLASTSYGAEFLQIQKENIFPIVTY